MSPTSYQTAPPRVVPIRIAPEPDRRFQGYGLAGPSSLPAMPHRSVPTSLVEAEVDLGVVDLGRGHLRVVVFEEPVPAVACCSCWSTPCRVEMSVP